MFTDFCDEKYRDEEYSLPPATFVPSSQKPHHQVEPPEKKRRKAYRETNVKIKRQADDEQSKKPKKQRVEDYDDNTSEYEPSELDNDSTYSDDGLDEDEFEPEYEEGEDYSDELDDEDRGKVRARGKTGLKILTKLQKDTLLDIFQHPPVCNGCNLKLSPSRQIYDCLKTLAPNVQNRTEKEGFSSCVYRWTYKNDKGKLIKCSKCMENLKRRNIEVFKGRRCTECQDEMVLKIMTEDKSSKYHVLKSAHNRKVAKMPLATPKRIKNEDTKEIIEFELPTICNDCKKGRKHNSYPVTKDIETCFAQTKEDTIATVKEMECEEGKPITQFIQGKPTDVSSMIEAVYKCKSRLNPGVVDKEALTLVYKQDLMEDIVVHERKTRQSSAKEVPDFTTFIKAAEEGGKDNRMHNSEWVLKNVINKLDIPEGTPQSTDEGSVKSMILDYCKPFIKDIKFKRGYKNFDHYLRTLLSTLKKKYPERIYSVDGSVYWRY